MVRTGDAEDLIRALDALLADPEGTLRMGEAARKDMACRWNWSHLVEDLVQVYERVRKSS